MKIVFTVIAIIIAIILALGAIGGTIWLFIDEHYFWAAVNVLAGIIVGIDIYGLLKEVRDTWR